jgi:thiol:disulfide interchange protein DsbA
MLKRIFRALLFCAALAFALHGNAALAAENLNSKGYVTLKQAQPQGMGEKIEVIEFFTYACPFCFAYEPALSTWVERNQGRISFKRVPVSLRPEWIPVQKLYFALEVLDKSESMHKRVFDAIHKERRSIKSDEAVGDLVEHLGLDRKQFNEAYFSAAVGAKIGKVLQMQRDYEVDQVPLVAVKGQYLTSPAKAGDMASDDKPFDELKLLSLKILDDLLVKSSLEPPKPAGPDGPQAR